MITKHPKPIAVKATPKNDKHIVHSPLSIDAGVLANNMCKLSAKLRETRPKYPTALAVTMVAQEKELHNYLIEYIEELKSFSSISKLTVDPFLSVSGNPLFIASGCDDYVFMIYQTLRALHRLEKSLDKAIIQNFRERIQFPKDLKHWLLLNDAHKMHQILFSKTQEISVLLDNLGNIFKVFMPKYPNDSYKKIKTISPKETLTLKITEDSASLEPKDPITNDVPVKSSSPTKVKSESTSAKKGNPKPMSKKK